MYEVEYKIEITKEEREKLVALFKRDNFQAKDSVTQNDYYIEAIPVENSPRERYHTKRYRDEGKTIFYTEKEWQIINGDFAVKEEEKEVSREEFLLQVSKYPDTVKIIKDRQSFSGEYKNRKMHIDMDTVKFDHSPKTRYFIEAEVMSEDKAELKDLREFIVAFLKESLGREDVAEAPGMFSLAVSKL